MSRFAAGLLVLGTVLATEGITPSETASAAIPSGLETELHCLALNVYWEARSESLDGQLAVAGVTLNRMRSEEFPNTICGVVTQGLGKRHQCQFSWWCDGKSDEPTEEGAWKLAKMVARYALHANDRDPSQGALFYHANYVQPEWISKLKRVRKIGRHIFYRDPTKSRIGNS
ncbi:cell wall hydrolase [Magnetospira sp. QH-2]|uniref:cell wall hydrolase n=1 Tax=Magnetospira sp. (strain QH-2) TaxID=1288970 RepID=UPI00130D99FB|nr:cell wall hydrolase [Magnetospira sp. QH-2]